jgi:hypothetical protein
MFDVYRHHLLLRVLKTQDVELYHNWFQIKYCNGTWGSISTDANIVMNAGFVSHRSHYL